MSDAHGGQSSAQVAAEFELAVTSHPVWASLQVSRRIAHEIEDMHLRNEFHYLAIMAAPGFLGLLRAALSKPLAQAVVATVRKDLLKQTEAAVKLHLPRHLFGMEGPFRPEFG